MRITQQQIAERAGVTRATVSYVLSGRARELKISDPVADRVRDIAAELGYVPNHAARALARGRSMTLGLLLGNAEGTVSPFWSPIVEGVEDAALARGYDVLLISARHDPETFGLSYLRQGRADALVALGLSARVGAHLWVGCRKPPVVVRPMGPEGLPGVALDPTPGLRSAIRHLTAMGHRRLLWLGPTEGLAGLAGLAGPAGPAGLAGLAGPGGPGGLAGRGAIASRLAAENGAALECIDLGPRPSRYVIPADGEIATWLRRLAARVPSPLPATAVLCWNDRLAIATRSLLARRGLSVPADVSIVGFDNMEAACSTPPLSTVSHEFLNMGRAATHLALRIAAGELSGPEARGTVVQVPSTFIARQSTGPARRRTP